MPDQRTVRYQAGGPRRVPGKWPHIVGPPDQPGEGWGGGQGETPWAFGSVSTRGAQAPGQPRNTRGRHGIQGTSRLTVTKKPAESILMHMNQQNKQLISTQAGNQSKSVGHVRKSLRTTTRATGDLPHFGNLRKHSNK